jgi:hypothetical protein
MARLKGLTKNQLTILTIGCADSAEGPYISMPDGQQVFLKASQLTWLARQIKSLQEGEPELEVEPEIEEKGSPENELDLVYGESGSGKTTWALQVAQWFWLRKKLKTRWYLGDGGGETIRQVIAAYGDPPFIEIWEYPLWRFPFETTNKMMAGGWPKDLNNPESPVEVPTSYEWLKSEYGLFVYEGLTVMSDYLMGDAEGGLSYRMAKGEVLNNDDSFRFKDGQLQIGGNARTHYGLVQRRIPHMLRQNARVPLFKIWTAHEQRAEDKTSNETVIGPDVAGKAITARSWAHSALGPPDQGGQLVKKKDPTSTRMVDEWMAERRAYTESHYDPNGNNFARYLANVRIPEGCPPGIIPVYYAPPEPLKFYADLETAQRLATKPRPRSSPTSN